MQPEIETTEPHHLAHKLNWLRAGVLGANDGIISIAGLVIGVASATNHNSLILTAGIAGLAAGSFSMAGGEYVSVSTQRDTEKAIIAEEIWNLENHPELEQEELINIYEKRGISRTLATQVVQELTKHNALSAHARDEHGINPNKLINPLTATFASFVAFISGGIIPFLGILLPPEEWKIAICSISVIFALIITGIVSSNIGNSRSIPAIKRNTIVGTITMILTYAIGNIFGIHT